MLEKNFIEEYKLLNEKQREVVDTIHQNILTLSPAGTGKTKAIALRIANMIKNGVSPTDILCLTFTNKACKEMKDRVISIVGKIGLNIKIKTFHGFCFDVIKSEAKKNTDIPADFLIADEEDCKEIIKEINRKGFNIDSLKIFIDEIKEHAIDHEGKNFKFIINDYFSKHERSFLQKINRDKGSYELSEVLKKYGYILVEKYKAVLGENHALDFTDLIVEVYKLFNEKEILRKWGKKFSYIQVDEVQDTSFLEYNIISKIAVQSNLSFFGDINQTIYEWRGSKPFTIVEDFKQKYGPVKEIYFTKNYRSTQTLIKSAANYIENCPYKDIVKVERLESNSKEIGEKIALREEENIFKEADWICDVIQQKYMDRLSDIAILTRANYMNKEISDVLEKRKIPCFLIEEFKFFRRREIKDLLAYIKLALNKYDNNSLKRILDRFVKNIGIKTVKHIESKEVKELGLRLTDFLEENTLKYNEPYKLLLDELENKNVIIFDVESTGIDTTKDEIIQIAAIRIDEYGNVKKFEELLKNTISVGESQLVHGFSDAYMKENGRDPEVVLEEFLRFIDDSVLVGHNVNYDISILRSQLMRFGMKGLNIKGYYDTLDLSRKFYPELENHKLETLSKVIGTKVIPNHNAMNDILATKDILLNMVHRVKRHALQRMNEIQKYKKYFIEVSEQIRGLREKIDRVRPNELLVEAMKVSEIVDYYKDDKKRIQNLKELEKIFENLDEKERSSRDALNNILEFTALSNSEIDRNFSQQNKIPIITVHQAKGLEFDAVFIAGLREDLFPLYNSKLSGDLSEEYRLFYVAMTRAKKKLYLSWHRQDRWHRTKEESRFIRYIDREFKEFV